MTTTKTNPAIDALRQRRATLAEQVRALGQECKTLVAPAREADRDLTAAERDRLDPLQERFDAAAKELRTVKARQAQAESDLAIEDSMMQMFGGSIAMGGGGGGGGKARDRRWSNEALPEMRGPRGIDSPSKSLAAPGSVLVPASFDPSVHRQSERPLSVRELIPTEVITTNTFAYLRQTERTLNAAPVAPGALKPTSVLKAERVEDRTRTIAHVSEPIARQDLADSADLGAFLDAELRFGVLAATETQILTGDGQGENITGVLGAEGVLVQPFAQDVFVTTRRALTLLQQRSITATAWVMNPGDWEGFELSRETSPSTGGFLLSSSPIDRSAQRLWSLPVVTSPIVPAGTAVLADWNEARVYQRQTTEVMWSDASYYAAANGEPASSGFQRNTLIMRAEERVGLALFKPSAFVEVDLTAGA